MFKLFFPLDDPMGAMRETDHQHATSDLTAPQGKDRRKGMVRKIVLNLMLAILSCEKSFSYSPSIARLHEFRFSSRVQSVGAPGTCKTYRQYSNLSAMSV